MIPELPSLNADRADFTFPAAAAFSPAARAAWERFGLLLVTGASDLARLASFRESLGAMVRGRLRSQGAQPDAGGDLDALFNQLCAIERKLGGGIVDAGKETAEFVAMMSDPFALSLARFVMNAERVHAPFGLSLFRVDRPNESRYTFDWHQDFPYNLLSRSGVTTWIPLTDVTPEMGPMKVVPGSHRSILPVRAITRYEPGKALSNRFFSFADELSQELEARAVEVPAQAGDLVIFSTTLAHRSGENRSGRSRWVANIRYGDLLDGDVVGRGWRIPRGSNLSIFHELFPELVTVVD